MTTTSSKSPWAASSAFAVSSRRAIASGVSVPRPVNRLSSASQLGGAKKTDEIAEEYWEGVVEACKSGWEPLPAKDEEL